MTIIKRSFVDRLEARVAEPLNFMQVVVGPRQVGKTTGVEQLYQNWHGSKVFATADLPAPPSTEWIVQHWNNARDKSGDVLLIFDEIQKIPRWSEVVKMLFDKDRSSKRLRVILLGSASIGLSTGLNDSLAGRFERTYVPHWSFKECQTAYGWDIETYLQYGGYPAGADLIADPPRWKSFLLNSIIEPAISRDILGLASIRKPALFRQVFELAMNFPAQEISYQKLLGQLQDPGNLVTIRHYLEILQHAFLLHLLPKFSGNLIMEKRSSPKIIPACPALITGLISNNLGGTSLRGRIFESVVGSYLIDNYGKVSYWRKGNFEVDYVVEDQSKLYAIEVKSGRVRTRSGLSAFLKEYPDAIAKSLTIEDFIRLQNGIALSQL